MCYHYNYIQRFSDDDIFKNSSLGVLKWSRIHRFFCVIFPDLVFMILFILCKVTNNDSSIIFNYLLWYVVIEFIFLTVNDKVFILSGFALLITYSIAYTMKFFNCSQSHDLTNITIQ